MSRAMGKCVFGVNLAILRFCDFHTGHYMKSKLVQTQNITSVCERISLVLGQYFSIYHRVKVRPQCSSEYSSPT